MPDPSPSTPTTSPPPLLGSGPALSLTVPPGGIRDGDLLLRHPREEDVDALLPALADPELREAGNLPEMDRAGAVAMLRHLPALAASGRMLPLIVVDTGDGRPLGGATLHHLDSERGIVEIGYWLFPHARGRGLATRVARMLAEHAFTLDVQRVEAYVNVGNFASDRVLDRAGFTREGVIRSLPRPDGSRVDKTLYSLLPGE